jgi:hypothetical protein
MQVNVSNEGIDIVPSVFVLKNRQMGAIFAIIVRKIAIFYEFFTPIFAHEVEIIVAHGLLFLKIRYGPNSFLAITLTRVLNISRPWNTTSMGCS